VVLLEPVGRVSDGPYNSVAYVNLSADPVNQPSFDGVPVHGIDGEIPSARILLKVRIIYFVRATTVCVAFFGSECCHFDIFCVDHNEDNSELSSNRPGFREQGFHLGRMSVGGYVVVTGNSVDDEITDAAPGKDGIVTVLLEFPDDTERFSEGWGLGPGEHKRYHRIQVYRAASGVFIDDRES
jgi:hypothetical protein